MAQSRYKAKIEARQAARQNRAALTDPGPVMAAAGTFLGVRQRSVAETRQRLLALGYPAPLVDDVVTRLIETAYLDDEKFARAWIESRDRARPRGSTGLRRELALKGVPREIVDEALIERDGQAGDVDPDLAAAAALLERKRSALSRELDPQRRRNKAYALLARNGFDPETCRLAISAALHQAQADGDDP